MAKLAKTAAQIDVSLDKADTAIQPGDIGVTVQAYDADTAKYDAPTANFTGSLQKGGSVVIAYSDIGVAVEAYDPTILKAANIGVTVQAYSASNADYDDITANFTGALKKSGSDVLTAAMLGVSVQSYDADTAKTDSDQAWSAGQYAADNDLTYAATITPDQSTGNDFDITLEGNPTIANMSNPNDKQSGVIRLIQDATGSRVPAFGSNYVNVPPSFSTIAGAIDEIPYRTVYDGSSYWFRLFPIALNVNGAT